MFKSAEFSRLQRRMFDAVAEKAKRFDALMAGLKNSRHFAVVRTESILKI